MTDPKNITLQGENTPRTPGDNWCRFRGEVKNGGKAIGRWWDCALHCQATINTDSGELHISADTASQLKKEIAGVQ